MSDDGIKVNITKTVNHKEIQKFMKQASINILVGFPSGMQHVPTWHRKDKKKDGYKGIHGEDPRDIQPVDTAELAKQLHYGTAEIPARPFLEDGIKQNIGQIKRAMQDEAHKLKETGKANWNKVGTMAVGAITELVRGDYYKQRVPNSKTTIEYKGSDKPLIDGGNMIQSLTFLVDDGEKK